MSRKGLGSAGVFRRMVRPMIVSGGIAIVCALLFLAGLFQSLSHSTTDRLFAPRAVDERIRIVAIDDASIRKIGRWPWDRTVHAKLIRTLAKSGAAVIAYDVNFPETQTKEKDESLAHAIEDAGNVVLPIELQITERQNVISYDPRYSLQSISEIGGVASRSGHSNTPPDRDGVVRRIPLDIRDEHGNGSVYAFAYEAVRLVDPSLTTSSIPQDAEGRVIVSYPNAPGKAFPIISAVDVLQGSVDLSSLKGAIVFVGSTAYDLHDAQLVPTSEGVLMSGVELHAALTDTMLSHAWLRPIPLWVIALLIVVIGLLFGAAIPFLRIRWSFLIAVMIWIGTIGTSFVLFDRGLMTDLVWPTIGIFASYAGVMVERRLAAERDRQVIRRVFSQYVSPSVVDAILRNPERVRLGGERRTMTVLFADIRNFTSLTEHANPQELVGWLNAFLHRMTHVIFDRRGVLDKYIGDAVMAFWNAPLHEPNHPTLAVEAALDMKDALEQMNVEGIFGHARWGIGIGINTGDMVVGNVGGEAHADYTVIGDSVNLASRLEDLTKIYGATIIISQETASHLGDTFLLRRLDRVMVKGRTMPVDIVEVVDRIARATPGDRERVRVYEKALDAYHARRFTEVVTMCEQTVGIDHAAGVLCDRAKANCDHEVPGDWDGTWVYTEKKG